MVSFLPFPTRLLAEHIEFRDAERVAVTIYGLWLLFASAMLSVLWRYALHAKLVSDTSKDEEIQLLTRRLTPGLAGYLVAPRDRARRPVRRGGRLPRDRDLLPGPDPDHASGPQAERLTVGPGIERPARTVASRRTRHHRRHGSRVPSVPRARGVSSRAVGVVSVKDPGPPAPSSTSVAVVIVTCHPDAAVVDRLRPLIGQVGGIVVVDHGSDAEELAPLRSLAANGVIELVNQRPESGPGLRHWDQRLAWAETHHYGWALTLDQDTQPGPGVVAEGARVVRAREADRIARDRRRPDSTMAGRRPTTSPTAVPMCWR